MKKKSMQIIMAFLLVLLWGVMFMAGSDIWNATGRISFWHLQGPPYTDMKVFVSCFYGLAGLLFVNLVYNIASFLKLEKS